MGAENVKENIDFISVFIKRKKGSNTMGELKFQKL